MKVVAGLDIGHIEQYYYQESLDNETKTGARIVRADDTEHTMYDVQCSAERSGVRGESECICTRTVGHAVGYTQI